MLYYHICITVPLKEIEFNQESWNKEIEENFPFPLSLVSFLVCPVLALFPNVMEFGPCLTSF